jgi:hypothetical protein
MHATCPHGSEAARIRTALIHHPDGDPTEAIYTPGRYFASLPHHNLTFWLLVSYFLSAFGFISSLFVFLCIEKWKLTSKINCKCVYKVSTKITMRKINDTRSFVNEVETQLRGKPLRGSQTKDIHYSEDKA